MQNQVRFYVYCRIKLHNPPLLKYPVTSFRFQSCDHSSQAAKFYLIIFLLFRNKKILCIVDCYGLLRSLISFATHAFAFKCQELFRTVFSQSNFLQSSTNIRPYSVISYSYTIFKKQRNKKFLKQVLSDTINYPVLFQP